VNSWLRSACYPRRTFYPLSDGPSIRNHRITKSCFRTCSTCMSRSQARLCLYTLRLISKQPEPTFERLRYSLGGDRPSQTTRLAVSLSGLREQVRTKQRKGGISPLAPPSPKTRVQSLPPILRIAPKFTTSCSKGARGLSVLCGKPASSPVLQVRSALVETALRSLRHSCRSELTRQGISLP
jgi:hypothetical protein